MLTQGKGRVGNTDLEPSDPGTVLECLQRQRQAYKTAGKCPFLKIVLY